MNKLITLAFAAFSLTTLSAQTFDSVRVHFDQTVQVAGNALPAGNYVITMIRSNGDVPLVRFTSDHAVSVVAFASRVERFGGDTAPRTDVVLDKTSGVERVAKLEIEGSNADFIFAVSR